MPRLELRVPADTLTDEQQSQLTEELTDTMLEVEGASPDNDMAQSIAWVFIEEYEPEAWTIGGDETTDLAFDATVTVPEGSLDQDGKERMVEKVTGVLSDVGEGDFDLMKAWVIINEVPDGNWGAAGAIFRYDDIVRSVSGD